MKCRIENCKNDAIRNGLCEQHQGNAKTSLGFALDVNYALHSALLLGGRWLHKLLDGYDHLFSMSEMDTATLHRNLALHYRKKGDLAKAIESLKKVKAADPSAMKGSENA